MYFLDRNLDHDRDGDLLQIHEPLAADADRLPLDLDCDPIADLVPGVVVGRQIQPQLLGAVENRQGNRMMKFTLGDRRELKDPLGREAGAAMIRPTSGRSWVKVPVLSKSTVSTCVHLLQGPPVLDENALVRRP